MIPAMAEPIRILHLDADNGYREQTSAQLEQGDVPINVISAASISQALETLQNQSVHAILSSAPLIREETSQNSLDQALQQQHRQIPIFLYSSTASNPNQNQEPPKLHTNSKHLTKPTTPEEYSLLSKWIKSETGTQNEILSPFNTVEGFALLDENLKYKIINEDHASTYGYDDTDALLGTDWFKHYEKSARESLSEKIRELQPGESWSSEFTRDPLPESVAPHRVTVTRLQNGEYGCFVKNLQEKRLLDQELERKEIITENIPDICLIVNDEGIVTYQNRLSENTWDYPLQDLRGESPLEYVHPDDQDALLADYQHLLSNPGTSLTSEYRFQTSTGKWRWFENHAIDKCDNPRIEGILVTARDISKRKQQEQQLRKSNERQRLLFEKAPDSIIIHDREGNILEVNSKAVELTGYSRPELLSMKIQDIEVGFTETQLKQNWGRMVAGNILQAEGKIKRANDTTCPIEVWINKIDIDGKTRYLAHSRDITERREREKELESTKSRLSLALDAANAGVWEWNLETDEILWDESTERLFGIKDGSFSGEYDELLEYIHPEDKSNFDGKVQKIVNDGGEFTIDFRVNNEANEQLWLTARGRVLASPDSEYKRMIGVVIDNTEQRKQQDRFEALVEQSTDIISILDENGTFQYQSPSINEILGHDPDSLIGEDAFDYIHPDHRERIWDEFKTAITDLDSNPKVVYNFKAADGSWRWLESRGNNQLNNPAVGGFVINTRDITRQKEYEKELEVQRDNLEVLNEVVRHDIRNKLVPISGYTDILADRVDDAHESYVESMQASVQDAIETTEMAAKVTKITLQDENDLFPIQIRDILEDEVAAAEQTHEEAEITIERPLTSAKVLGDQMLPSIFTNLLDNAVTHNDAETARITVSTSETESKVSIRVADNGPGITDEKLESVFEKGVKGVDSDGTGLGLFLVDTLVERYQGGIWIENTEVDGTVFVVQLPKAD